MDAQDTIIDRLFQLMTEDADKEAFVFYNAACERSSVTRKELVNLGSRLVE